MANHSKGKNDKCAAKKQNEAQNRAKGKKREFSSK
jgi:hypothetical protein